MSARAPSLLNASSSAGAEGASPYGAAGSSGAGEAGPQMVMAGNGGSPLYLPSPEAASRSWAAAIGKIMGRG
ncbi:hypothetical protein PAPYR_11359 [Paratrimastix pyriformis]|uniref:Uncharacterized protein n=1 Tax=Paratrimastix pyriformis TaxID=342808 RepID=A0ABQ8U6I0_9EUKA|nr:hypothetical protein PAPYR_11359 [Paratrimastix pyriformis]